MSKRVLEEKRDINSIFEIRSFTGFRLDNKRPRLVIQLYMLTDWLTVSQARRLIKYLYKHIERIENHKSMYK